MPHYFVCQEHRIVIVGIGSRRGRGKANTIGMTSIWKRPVDLILVVVFINFAMIAAMIGIKLHVCTYVDPEVDP